MLLRSWQRRLALVMLAAVAVAGCGSAARRPVVLDRATVSRLDRELTLARSALADHSRGQATAALDAFSRLVESHAGEISSVDLRNLRIAIAQARARIPVDIIPVVASPPPQPASKPTPAKTPTPPKPKPPKAPKPPKPKPPKAPAPAKAPAPPKPKPPAGPAKPK